MGLKEDEATAWASKKVVARAAVVFVARFLGLTKGGGNTALSAADLDRWVDIVRAVSWVESRHGTGTGQQPARDPMQCGNPNDTWWKELTGQTAVSDRFVRGPSLSNLYAHELPAAADAAAGFDAAASLSKLGGDKKKGHDVAAFAPEHSYFWGVPILVHKANTAAGDKTYQCGALDRARLVRGARGYNGNGDADYETKITAALDLFDGLPDLVA